MRYATVAGGGREVVLSKVFVDDVVVPPRLRPLDTERVAAIGASIIAIGLQHPISVYIEDDEVVLVAGLHRLEAFKELDWEEIPAIKLHMDDIDRQLWEIDENLQRANLTPAEEADHLKRRAELWEARETAGTNCPTSLSDGRAAGPQHAEGFASETAAATGRSKRDINRAIARAENIESDVMEAVQGTVLDKGVELDALAKMEPDEQRAAVAAVESGETDTVREKPTRSGLWLVKLKNVYRQSPKRAQKAFLKWVAEAA